MAVVTKKQRGFCSPTTLTHQTAFSCVYLHIPAWYSKVTRPHCQSTRVTPPRAALEVNFLAKEYLILFTCRNNFHYAVINLCGFKDKYLFSRQNKNFCGLLPISNTSRVFSILEASSVDFRENGPPHKAAWDGSGIDGASHHWGRESREPEWCGRLDVHWLRAGRAPHDSLSKGKVHTTQLLWGMSSFRRSPEMASVFGIQHLLISLGRMRKSPPFAYERTLIPFNWTEIDFVSENTECDIAAIHLFTLSAAAFKGSGKRG